MADGLRVLYVDDEPALLEIGKLFLEADGEFIVDTLTSAREALAQLNTAQYDAIISDYQMPEMNGITFLKQLKASGNATPFIIFTGRGREEIVIEALNSGADFYLQKGGEPKSQFAELAHKIHQAVQQRRAVASIRDLQRKEADIINFLPDATFAIDTQGVVIAWNRAMERMTGVASDRVLGKGNHEYAIPFYHERRPLLIDLVLKEDPVTVGKYPTITRDGTTLFSEITIPHFNNGRGAALWFTASPLYNTQGTIVGAIESIREITERKQAEEALHESERRFRELSDLLPQIVYETDIHGNLKYANHIAFEQFGYSEDELQGGLNVLQMISPPDRERAGAALRRMIENGIKTGPSAEYQALRKDGSTFPITIYSSLVFVNNRITGLRGIIVDISERRQSEEALAISGARLRRAELIAGLGHWEFDLKSRDVYASEGARSIYGLSDEHWNISEVQNIPLPEYRPMLDEALRALIKDNRPYDVEFRIQRPTDGKIVDIHSIAEYDPTMKVVFGVILDITGLKWAENAIHRSEQKYRTVFETTGTATILIGDDHTILLANSEFARLSGYTKEEIENKKKWSEFVIPEDRDRMLSQHRLRRTDQTRALTRYEFRFVTRSGDIRYIHLTIDMIPGTTQSVASLLDITERKKGEDNLIEATQEYTNLLNQIQDIYYRTDTEGRLVKGSQSLATLLGYDDVAECLGRNIAEDFWVNSADRIPFMEEVYRQGKVTDYEVQMKRKDGSGVLVSTRSHLNYDAAGKIAGIEGTFRDITNRRQAEERLWQLTDAIEASIDGISILDESQNFVYMNKAHARIYGYDSPDELKGKSWRMLYDDGERERFDREIMPEFSRTGQFHGRALGKKKDTSTFPQEISLTALPQGGLICVVRDITKRTQVEDALKESEERFRTLADNLQDAVIIIDFDASVQYANNAALRLAGIPLTPNGETLRIDRFLAPESQENALADLEIIRINGGPRIAEYRMLSAHGEMKWVEAVGIRIPWKGMDRDLVALRDITGRKQAAEALLQSEEKFRTMVEASPDMLWEIDTRGNFTYISSQSSPQLGYTPGDLIGRPFASLIQPGSQESVIDTFRSHIEEKSSFVTLDVPACRNDGSPLTIEIRSVTVMDDTGRVTGFRGIARDITGRKQTEEILRENSRKYAELFELGSEAIFLIDNETGALLEANAAAGEMYGYPRELLLTMKNTDLSGEKEETKKVTTDSPQGMVRVPLRYHKRSDGTIFPVEIIGRFFTWHGRPVHIAAIREITEQKRVEEALRQANRKLNLLSGITRHDIKNQLLALDGFLELLHRKSSNPALEDYFTRITQVSSRISAMIRFTKEYEKIGVTAPAWQDIRTLVEIAAKESPLGKVCVKNDIPDGAEVFADPLIARVFYNLMDNAARYGGKITFIRFSVQECNGNGIVLCEDDGDGIPAGEKELIFDQGFGRNTGMGLFLAREILSITDITIRENGVPGEGARFEITMPSGCYRKKTPADNEPGAGR